MRSGWWRSLAVVSALACAAIPCATRAATFPGNARVEAQGPSGGLSWGNSFNALTVSCWFKHSVPITIALTQNMTILANSPDGNESGTYASLRAPNPPHSTVRKGIL